MRLRSGLLTWLLLVAVVTATTGLLGMLPVSAGAPEPTAHELSQLQQEDQSELTGSVVVRDAPEVSAASVDFADYAAGRYIVRFASTVRDAVATTDRLARSIGFSPTHIYTERTRGFAAKLDADQVERLERRAEIAAIETDDVIPAPSAYNMPTGVERIGALANGTAKINGSDQRVNVDVAVVDSGVQRDNPDLNVTRWFDCTSAGGDGSDDLGHGTHVAGTIGALDNGIGVTGVAPGARIWSIKIFTAASGLESWALCGIELLADYGSSIDVANLSWGWWESGADGPCSETTFHQAICNAYNAGVTLVNAAGNQGFDAYNTVPTTYSQVIAVSAIVDTDGKIGGLGPDSSRGCDDCFATFSNFGADIDLAAPGVNILSTCPTYLSCNAGSGLARQSGTSMSAPHAAGAAALYIARNGRVGPSSVRSALIANSDPGSISGDPDGIHERVLYVGDLNPACSISPSAGSPGKVATLSCTRFRATETINLSLDSSNGTKFASFTVSARGHGSIQFPIPNATKGTHQIVAKGATSSRTDQSSYRIAATMSLSPSSGASGATVTVRLAGFSKGETVTLRLDPGSSSQRTLKTGVAIASNGSKVVSVTIPVSTTLGKHKVEASGSLGTKLSRTFTVTVGPSSVTGADVTPSPTATPTETPAITETVSQTPSSEATPTETPIQEPTPSPTETPTPEPTATETPTPEPLETTPEVTPAG